MVGAYGFIAVGIIAAVVIVLALYLSLVLRRGRRLGTQGFVQRSRLTCPKCRQPFDYDWVPGVAFTAVRLGKGRYMACPLCHRWSYMNIYDTMVARTDSLDPIVGTVGPR
ncbi:MAG: hypothetical protein L3K11_00935 [Thermoplasmata archaeon]|nr:hypothetical protein [Thermoplasmata archaeon]